MPKRTVSVAERNAAKGSRWAFYQMEVTNPDGTWLNLCALTVNGSPPKNFLNTATISKSIDDNTLSLTAVVKREIGSISLAPLRTDSPINARADFSYAPGLDLRRKWRIRAITKPWGSYPLLTDYRPLAEGIITTLDISGEPPESRNPGTITITGRGMETPLLALEMLTAQDYVGAAIATRLQAMLDRWNAGATVTPDGSAPAYFVNAGTQDAGTMMPALQRIAQLPGAVLRYMYDAADVNQFMLFTPNRTPTTPDYTFGPKEYKAIPVNRLDLDPVRNYIELTYPDATFGPQTITSPQPEATTVSAVAGAATFSASPGATIADDAIIVVDGVAYEVSAYDAVAGTATLSGAPTFTGRPWITSASITRYGMRPFPFTLAADEGVTDAASGYALIDAMRSDLEFPILEQQIMSEGAWFVELYDYLQLDPNGTHYTDAQFGGVTSVVHTFAGGKLETTIGLRGKPAGGYRSWLSLGTGGVRTPMVPGITKYSADYWETYALDGITLTGAGVMDLGEVNQYTRSVAVEVSTDPTFATVEFIEYTDVAASSNFSHQWAGASRASIYWFRATPWSGPLDGGGLPTGVAGPPAIARTWNTPQVPTKPAFDNLSTTVAGIVGDYIPIAQKGAASGVATLDSGGKIPTTQLPALAITDTFVVASQAAMLALTAEVGDVAIRTDVNKTFILQASPATTLANWKEILTPGGGVSSFNGRTGAVMPAAGDYAVADVTGAAPLASPTFTGDPKAPTPSIGDGDTSIATTAFVANDYAPAFTTLVDGATVTWATGGARVSHAKLTIGGNRTLSITGAVAGATGYLEVTQDATGGRILTLPSGKIVGSTTGIGATANKVTAIAWSYNGTSFTFVLAAET